MLEPERREPMASELVAPMPPQDLNTEVAVLGSLLLNPAMCDEVRPILRPEDFYSEANGKVYGCILALLDAGIKIDVVTLCEALKKAGDFEFIGGAARILELSHAVPVAAHAAYYARIVREKSQKRSLIRTMGRGLSDCYDDSRSADEIRQWVQDRLDQLSGTTEIEVVEARTATAEAMSLARRAVEGGGPRGLTTGLESFDDSAGGLYPGELVILAARPGVGKSAMGMQFAMQTAIGNRGVLFISLEMSRAELMSRLLCGKAEIDASLVRTGRLNDHEFQKLEEVAPEIAGLPLHICDRPGLTAGDVRSIARRIHRKAPLALLVVDYLQRLMPADARIHRYEQIGRMTGELKQLARELNLPVLCLAQLNRQADGTTDAKPRLSHLRESGNIEADCDMCLLLHREELSRRNDPDVKGKALLIVAKNRNGPTGEFELYFDGPTTSFRSPVQPYQEFAAYSGKGF